MARLRGVVYDLDGTLIDSRADIADSVNAMLRRMGLPEHEHRVVWSFVGEGAELLIRRALGPLQQERYPEAARRWREEYGERMLVKTRLYHGVAALLSAPPALRAVLSNKPGDFARKIVRALGVGDAFGAVLGGDEGPRKPAPDGLLLLCARLGIAPAEALLVGDSAVDIQTGKAAGVPTCAVGWGPGERSALSLADHLCETPAELCALLGRLGT